MKLKNTQNQLFKDIIYKEFKQYVCYKDFHDIKINDIVFTNTDLFQIDYKVIDLNFNHMKIMPFNVFHQHFTTIQEHRKNKIKKIIKNNEPTI